LKTIIIYATKSGASRKCAVELAAYLPDATLVDGAKAAIFVQRQPGSF
jgi:menaquinone-dependent protoporphyrinogen IX oxidase